MKKRIGAFALCILLLFCCSGCGGFKEDGEFTYLLPQNVTSLDPQTASGSAAGTVIDSIFEGLCRIDQEGETVPGVADRWESNDSHTEFTFYLRSNARWSNGDPVTADDFLFGITRALSTNSGALAEDLLPIQNARAFASGQCEESDLGVTALDDHTLVIRLEESNPDFPSLTASAHYMPCNRAYFQESAGHYGLSSQYLITNGPFTFSSMYSWQTDTGSRSITLTRSSNYRGERKVRPAKITFLIDYDSAYNEDPVAALLSGEVDILSLTASQAASAEEQGCELITLDDAVTGLLLNPQCDKLENTTLRSLFFKTLDRADLLSRRENAREASGIMADCVQWDGESYYADGTTIFTQQDPSATDKIPSLLQSLDLDQIPSITVICPEDDTSIQVANGFLVAWNKALGNAFNIEPLSETEFQRRIASGEYEAALYSLRAGGTTPYDVLKAFESTAFPTLFSNPSYDQALSQISFDLASYREAEQLLEQNYVFYPIFRDNTYYATNPNTKGITVAPDQNIDFTNARKR